MVIKMEEKNADTGFKYTYSAKEQEEIKRIRQKYMLQEESAITRLRKLDEKVTGKAMVISLMLGIWGSLIMGIGMSLLMTDLAYILGMEYLIGMVIGIIGGIVGMILVILAYPVYKKVLKSEREKMAPEILRLSEELFK